MLFDHYHVHQLNFVFILFIQPFPQITYIVFNRPKKFSWLWTQCLSQSKGYLISVRDRNDLLRSSLNLAYSLISPSYLGKSIFYSCMEGKLASAGTGFCLQAGSVSFDGNIVGTILHHFVAGIVISVLQFSDPLFLFCILWVD